MYVIRNGNSPLRYVITRVFPIPSNNNVITRIAMTWYTPEKLPTLKQPFRSTGRRNRFLLGNSTDFQGRNDCWKCKRWIPQSPGGLRFQNLSISAVSLLCFFGGSPVKSDGFSAAATTTASSLTDQKHGKHEQSCLMHLEIMSMSMSLCRRTSGV